MSNDPRFRVPVSQYPRGMEPGDGSPQAGAVVPAHEIPTINQSVQGIDFARPFFYFPLLASPASVGFQPGSGFTQPLPFVLIGVGGQYQVPVVPDNMVMVIEEVRTYCEIKTGPLPAGRIPFCISAQMNNFAGDSHRQAQSRWGVAVTWRLLSNSVPQVTISGEVVSMKDDKNGVMVLRPGELFTADMSIFDSSMFFSYLGLVVRGSYRQVVK